VSAGDYIRFTTSHGSSSNGREFIAYKDGQYRNTQFETFCVQEQENIDFSGRFYVSGVTGASIGLGGNPLNPYTAWLFTQFRAGIFANYDYLTSPANRSSDAEDLQKLIWYYEGETSKGEITGKGVGWNNAAVAAGWRDIGNVRVINLKYENGSNAQDVLTIISQAPSGCSGDVVVLQNMTFVSGQTYSCIATTSITAGTGVTVQSGAIVNFRAPKINLQPGFRVESGAVFSAKQ